MASSWESVACFILLSGCALDNRTLHLAEGAGGDSNDPGQGSLSGSSTGKPKPPEDIDLPVCSYSLEEVEPGCETIVSNAGFGKDIAAWEAEPLAIAVSWDNGDATGSDESGSIAVINSMHGTASGIAPGGGMQCVPAAPGTVYDMAGDVYVPDGQGDGLTGGPYAGMAGLSILFWPNKTCSKVDETLDNAQTPLIQDVGVWTHVEGSALAPDGTVAMSVRVLTVKQFKQFNFKALFDNVLVQRR